METLGTLMTIGSSLMVNNILSISISVEQLGVPFYFGFIILEKIINREYAMRRHDYSDMRFAAIDLS